MYDKEREERILFLLKVWFFIQERQLAWHPILMWIEKRLNDEVSAT